MNNACFRSASVRVLHRPRQRRLRPAVVHVSTPGSKTRLCTLQPDYCCNRACSFVSRYPNFIKVSPLCNRHGAPVLTSCSFMSHQFAAAPSQLTFAAFFPLSTCLKCKTAPVSSRSSAKQPMTPTPHTHGFASPSPNTATNHSILLHALRFLPSQPQPV